MTRDIYGRPEWWQADGIGFDQLVVAAKKSSRITGKSEIVHRHSSTVNCSGECVEVTANGVLYDSRLID